MPESSVGTFPRAISTSLWETFLLPRNRTSLGCEEKPSWEVGGLCAVKLGTFNSTEVEEFFKISGILE